MPAFKHQCKCRTTREHHVRYLQDILDSHIAEHKPSVTLNIAQAQVLSEVLNGYLYTRYPNTRAQDEVTWARR